LGSALGVAVIGTLLTAQLTADLNAEHATPNGGTTLHTIAAMLAQEPARHHAVVIADYARSATSALEITAVIVFLTGTLVITELTWATRRLLRAAPSVPGGQAAASAPPAE
jgi:hypothetical protein